MVCSFRAVGQLGEDGPDLGVDRVQVLQAERWAAHLHFRGHTEERIFPIGDDPGQHSLDGDNLDEFSRAPVVFQLEPPPALEAFQAARFGQ